MRSLMNSPAMHDESNQGEVTPGQPVNCEGKLPCTWISEDSSLEFKIIYSDGIATPPYGFTLGPDTTYALGYEVRALTADSDLIFKDGSTARSADGVGFSSTRLYAPNPNTSSGGGYAPLTQLILRNTTLRIRNFFDKEVTRRGVMSVVNLDVVANEVIITPEFLNLPYGRAPSKDIDCQFELPCTWTSEDGTNSVSITQAQPDTATDELTVDFIVTTQQTAIEVALDYSHEAIGDNLFRYGTYTKRTIGDSFSYQQIVAAPVVKDVSTYGEVLFRYDEVGPDLTSLSRLQLHIYEGGGSWANSGWTPLWNPVWFNVPVSR